MANFFLGLQAIAEGIWIGIKQITQFQLFWGFAIGFLVSTIVHGFLISDNPKQIPSILFQDKAASFEKFYPRKKTGSYGSSFYIFNKNADNIKISFYLAGTTFFIIGLIAMLTFWI